jgi:GTP-binding protein HflX
MRRKDAVAISALTGAGVDELVERIRQRELESGEVMTLEIPHEESRLAARLHEVAQVYEQKSTDSGTSFTAWVPKDSVHLFEAFAAASLLKPARVS